MIRDVKMGKNIKIPQKDLVNLYGCELSDGVKIGAFVEIQEDATVGKNTIISSHSFICSNVHIGKNVFLGHDIMTTNDKNPTPNKPNFKGLKTVIGDYASIGSGVTLLPVKIGHHAIIGAGSMVTKNIPAYAIAYGNPAKIAKILTQKQWKKRVAGK